MREIDPFSYYSGRASVIAGFGGSDPAPAPNYAFHTSYVNVRPGPACFQLHVQGARATRGKLSLRVHALCPDRHENASFVAGARIDVAEQRGQDLCVSVPFAALRHTQYALYGQFIRDTDLRAEAISVRLSEVGSQSGDYVEPPRSVLAACLPEPEPDAANALLHVLPHHLASPVSQDCTSVQMAELAASAWYAQGIDDWAEALCLNALRSRGVTGSGLEGLIVGACSDPFSHALAGAGFRLRWLSADPVPPEVSGMFGDFLVWPEGLWPLDGAENRWHVIKAWLARLKIGGVGIVTCRFRPGDRGTDSHAADGGLPADGLDFTQSEIEQWALRLIGEGYAVAPLAFSTPGVQQTDAAGLVRFALVVRRI